MAERRMIAKTIVDSDAFIDLDPGARLLYYDLVVRADDEGFINSPKKIMRMTGASEEMMKELEEKKFIISFPSGIVVIKHWLIHNYIPKDRFHETKYKEERATLLLDENKAYSQTHGTCIQDVDTSVDNPTTEVRLGKDSLGKIRLDKDSLEEVRRGEEKIGEDDRIRRIEDAKRSLLNLYGRETHDA